MVLITFNLLLIINIMCNNLKCKFCGSNRINKIGKQKYNGKQRYLCRKARSGSKSSLLAIGSLSVSEVPKRSEGKSLCLSKSIEMLECSLYLLFNKLYWKIV